MFDVAMVNAWILFKIVYEENKQMRLAEFWDFVAESFYKA